ncbi:MAG: DNA polymerase III subunit alpha [Methylococcales bacterium]|nr:DNA polymerase III subunit alpha [Methylococcales bacterium]
MQPTFIHLRLHSEFSLVDGIVKIKPLVKRLLELNMPAVAITENTNLFSLVKFYKTTTGQGIKPIAGADVLLVNPDDAQNPYRLTLLVNNHMGYVTLTELISKAYQEGQHQGVPLLKLEWLVDNHAGLIALSGAMTGDIGKALLADNVEAAKRQAKFWAELFPDRFYLELQRVGKPDEERYIAAALDLAVALDLPVVATNDVRFLYSKDFQAHEVRVCINQGRVLDDPRRPKDYTDQQYLRSAEEMAALFADIPEALANTVEIAKRCNLTLTLGKNFLPDYPVPAGMTLSEVMSQDALKGLEERLTHSPAVGKGTDADNRQVYYDRLDFELKMITQMGFPGYFMIVADFIQWAKNHGIPVGPGRGSGAGSLVAYALKITDLDPIEFDLLFERFLNPERVSMPDFDIDFCMDRRDEVIQYVAEHYGRDHVAQIITYGSMAAKAVIRDVGRVSGLGYGFVDSLAKLVPFEIGMTLEKALRDSPDLKQRYDSEEDVKALINMALSLEGTVRNAGKHAGGVVISPTKLTDFTALYCDEEGNNLVTQFDKDDVEAVGLVKFDFLGLRTLTIIDWALQDINAKLQAQGKPLVDITLIPRDDSASYALLKNGDTTAVFQLESRGMKELIKKLKPDCFDDIIALVALFRPGPLESGMVDDYVNVKHKTQQAEYAHLLLEPILKPTNGVILYQEQVMQIAREMALYTLGGADMLRRAMGKKKPEEMAKERDKFITGSTENNVDESISSYVFDLMEKFAGYGFNKSHSAAYALVAYQTAWLKAHYQPEFMAAVLSSDMDNTDKVVILIEECQRMKLTILPPTINYSKYKFTVDKLGRIVYGLGAVKGVGEAAIEEMIVERNANGNFSGLYDLCKRVDLRKFNKRVLEALIRAGAFDVFDDNRAAHLAELPTALKIAEQHGKMAATGQNDLFGLAVSDDADVDVSQTYTTAVTPWSAKDRLDAEKTVLGLYLTGHPIDHYASELKDLGIKNIGAWMTDLTRSRGGVKARVAGLAIDIGVRQNKQGTNRGVAILDDNTGRLEIAAYHEVFDDYQGIFARDHKEALLIAEGSLSMDEYLNAPRLKVEKLYNIHQAREAYARNLTLTWASDSLTTTLETTLMPFKGGRCPVVIEYSSAVARATLQLGEAWRVHPTDELLVQLKAVFADAAVRYK